MIEVAGFETERHPKTVALIEAEPKHFASRELGFLEDRFPEFDQAQVTFDEIAGVEFYIGKIGFRKIALVEMAIIVLALW
jgi:hypothetical protein